MLQVRTNRSAVVASNNLRIDSSGEGDATMAARPDEESRTEWLIAFRQSCVKRDSRHMATCI